MVYEKKNIMSLSGGVSKKGSVVNEIGGVTNNIACVVKFYKDTV